MITTGAGRVSRAQRARFLATNRQGAKRAKALSSAAPAGGASAAAPPGIRKQLLYRSSNTLTVFVLPLPRRERGASGKADRKGYSLTAHYRFEDFGVLAGTRERAPGRPSRGLDARSPNRLHASPGAPRALSRGRMLPPAGGARHRPGALLRSEVGRARRAPAGSAPEVSRDKNPPRRIFFLCRPGACVIYGLHEKGGGPLRTNLWTREVAVT